jgi:SecD/SecF fusion protein
MIRLNRWWYALVIIVVGVALFIDTYSYTYRFVHHQGITGKLTSPPPTLLGRQLYIHKGLDLQGGTELTIAICQGPDNPQGSGCRSGIPKNASLAQAQAATVTILSQRVNSLGVAESNVQAQGSDQVLVQLPGVDIQTATKVIGTTARLYFGEAVANQNGAALPSIAELNANQMGHFNLAQVTDPQYYPTGYHWKINTDLDATNVTSATVNPSGTNGQVAVDITFDDHGASAWGDITGRAVAQPAGSALNRVAILLDNNVLTAPQVISRSTNQTEITGNFTTDSAKQLADQISAGSLPAEIATIQSTEVSASLGADTVRASLIAAAVGLLVVALFMIGYYRFPGVLAVTALLAYAAIVLALYKVIPVTVTLAGLAGFVLSVGMAVDANVLIFERTRDELRHGKAITAAVDAGFRRAWPAIRDSNVSTMIATLVLYIFGSSVVKGFALTLFLGVAVSMFSAILITQTLLIAVLHFRRWRNPRLYTELREDLDTSPPQGRFDIVSTRNRYFALSLAILVPGLIAIVVWGFRLGIDFAGGNRLDVVLYQPTTQAQVISTVNSVKSAQNYKPEVQAASNNEFIISTLPSPVAVVQDITNTLQSTYGIAVDANGHPKVTQTTVGPTIAHTLVRNAVILVLVSSLLIALYLAVRFGGSGQISRWRFSVCTFFKLLHDVFVLLGIWAILGHFSDLGQVDSLFVTAVLTSVAFSIHDTIVVFDRVRENLRTGARMTFDQVVNLSTVQTMTRSLNTALTVAFVLLALVLMGGPTIRGFVLALLIGIVTGTYSSIFNASTMLVAWNSVDKLQAPTGTERRPAGPRRVQRTGAAL